jgi:DNA-binding NarL/FixJ family response regulator
MSTAVATHVVVSDRLRARAAEGAPAQHARRGTGAGDRPVRVALADDQPLVRAGLRAVLASAPDVQVVGEASDVAEAVAMARRLAPAIVVMALGAPADCAEGTRALCALDRPPKVLALGADEECDERPLPLLAAGASGYLSRGAADGELVEAIRAVAAGEVYLLPPVARLLAGSLRRRDAPEPPGPGRQAFESLSARERDVLRLVAEGFNGPEVGRRLGISAKTVDSYRHRIDAKLGLSHRAQYVRLAVALGLIGG